MASENFDNFNERLSQWVANQGFWFQVRFSMASGGSKGVVMVHLVRFATRLLLLLAVAGIAGGVYLFNLPTSKKFRTKVEAAIGAGLGAEESKLSGFKRVQGMLNISKFASKGGSKTFFSTLEARSIKCQMGILNSLPGKWNLGVLSIGALDIHLNAGADDTESAKSISDSLFRDFGELVFETIDVREGTVRWGFSERTRGIISGSHLKIQRVPEGWRINVSGGQFSQNWLRRLDIVELVALCTRDGIKFEKAEFHKGPLRPDPVVGSVHPDPAVGRIRMDGLQVIAGERPEVKGVISLSQVPIEDIIPPAARDFVDGVISGEFRIFGSTNTKEGLGLEGKVTVDENNPIKLRDQIRLLRALTAFAVYSNFKTVEFNEGSMTIKTQAGGMELSEVQLKSTQDRKTTPEKEPDLMTLTGQMQVRFPTKEEAEAALKRNSAGESIPGIGVARESLGSASADDDLTISLRKAAAEARRAREKAQAGGKEEQGPSLFDWIGQTFEERQMTEEAVERESRNLHYEGAFQITVLADTFDTMPSLRKWFPVDSQSGRIPMDVPVKGDLDSITRDQTDDLYLRAEQH